MKGDRLDRFVIRRHEIGYSARGPRFLVWDERRDEVIRFRGLASFPVAPSANPGGRVDGPPR